MFRLLFTAVLLMLTVWGNAQNLLNDFDRILIRNVTVIDQTGKTGDVVVNILMRGMKLGNVGIGVMAPKSGL